MPLTFGGGIRSMADVDTRINTGADKISINSLAIEQPTFITQAAKKYGSKAIVISVDVKKKKKIIPMLSIKGVKKKRNLTQLSLHDNVKI